MNKHIKEWLAVRGIALTTKDAALRKGGLGIHLEDYRRGVRFAWRLLTETPTLGVGVELHTHGGEEDVTIDVGLLFARLFVGWDGFGLPDFIHHHIKRVKYRYSVEYAARLQWHGGPDELDNPLVLRWNFGRDPDTHSYPEPRWQRGSLRIYDLLFGKETHTVLTEVEREVEVPLPEGPRKACAVARRHRFSRLRWTEPRELTTVEISFDGFVETGHQKRGGLRGSSRQARGLEDGIGKLVGDIVTERLENGLRADGTDPKKPSVRDLLIDQCHAARAKSESALIALPECVLMYLGAELDSKCGDFPSDEAIRKQSAWLRKLPDGRELRVDLKFIGEDLVDDTGDGPPLTLRYADPSKHNGLPPPVERYKLSRWRSCSPAQDGAKDSQRPE